MKNLIIHPQDSSTSFLNIVYKNISNKTVITGGITSTELNGLIKTHDRVMMMGHGWAGGLFGVGQFIDCGTIINRYTVPYLMEKKNNIFIWCNADKFVNEHELKGFYSGMFISEVGEADYCGIPGMSQHVVDESNYGFCNIISECINESKQTIFNNVVKEYKKIAENNPVALYNVNRLYLR